MNKFIRNISGSPYLRLLCIPLITYAFLLGVKAHESAYNHNVHASEQSL